MKSFVKTFHYLSFDVVAGVCICSIFIAKVLSISPSFLSLVSLGLTVWIIYTFDHYMDALHLKVRGKPRHQFHLRNKSLIKILLAIALGVNAVLLILLPTEVLKYGIGLLILVIGYFLLTKLKNHYAGLFKEFFAALIYSAGLFIPSITPEKYSVIPTAIILYVVFFLLAWINLLLFSWFDFDYDRKAGFLSLVNVTGKKFSSGIIWALLAFYFILWISLYFDRPVSLPADIKWTAIMMGGTLMVLILKPQLFIRRDRYRILGDAVFLIPLMPLLL